MTKAFDQYHQSYEKVVTDSIAFSGLKHDFFLEAKLRRLAVFFTRHFGQAKPSLLDVGCGVGRMHGGLLRLCSQVSGTDSSPDCLHRAKADNPDVSYVPGHGDILPFADASHDVVLAVCVLHHVPLNKRSSMLAEMHRTLRPGGFVVIIEHNPWNPLTQLAVSRCPFDHDAELLDWREAQRLLKAAQLASINSEHFLLLPSAAPAMAMIEGLFGTLPFGAQYMSWGCK